MKPKPITRTKEEIFQNRHVGRFSTELFNYYNSAKTPYTALNLEVDWNVLHWQLFGTMASVWRYIHFLVWNWKVRGFAVYRLFSAMFFDVRGKNIGQRTNNTTTTNARVYKIKIILHTLWLVPSHVCIRLCKHGKRVCINVNKFFNFENVRRR